MTGHSSLSLGTACVRFFGFLADRPPSSLYDEINALTAEDRQFFATELSRFFNVQVHS